uniref:Amino acid transporter transmembrane domain-containing protein n=1 Tax=Timema bartmani TaxID=61472 RepID=A0A7R9F1D8_9NEOP|nr:unnamed protein product [Timema bartmani]
MPNAFLHSGYVLGTVGTLAIGLICTYCIHMLVCDVYLPPLDVRVFMVFLLLPLILINWIRNLKLLAPFSTAANIITFVGFGIILYYLVTQVETLADKEPLGELAHIPLFFGTVLFALEAIGVILPLENNMKTPGSFGGACGVLNQAMITIILLYVGMGFIGYMTYGAATAGSITINLPKDEPLAQSVKLMLSVAIFVSHGLQCYIAVDITWGQYLLPRLEKHRHKTFIEYVVRAGLVLVTCECNKGTGASHIPTIVLVTVLLAVAIPRLELFISLFGALCLSALGIVLPAIIQTSTFWYSLDRSHLLAMVVKNLLLVLFGVFGLVVGTYTALSDIFKSFQ